MPLSKLHVPGCQNMALLSLHCDFLLPFSKLIFNCINGYPAIWMYILLHKLFFGHQLKL
jgi:hypothetical protein